MVVESGDGHMLGINSTKMVLLIGFIILMASILLMRYFGQFDMNALISGLGLSTIMFFGTLWAMSQHKKILEPKEKKKDFNYDWQRLNEIIRNRTNGDVMEWDMGIGMRSEIKSIKVGEKIEHYRSFYGYLYYSRQEVIVIYQRDKEDIVRWFANPSPEVINDPFKFFEPYQDKLAEIRAQSMARNNKKGKGMRFRFDDDTPKSIEPADDDVRNVLKE